MRCEKGIIHVTFLSLLFFFHRMRALLLLLWGANRIVSNRNLGFSHIYFFVLILVTPYVCAQAPETASDATVTYPAEYFAQFNPYSVNDMLQRIPGISLARSGSRSQSRGGGRGLGAGGEQVLINGRHQPLRPMSLLLRQAIRKVLRAIFKGQKRTKNTKTGDAVAIHSIHNRWIWPIFG